MRALLALAVLCGLAVGDDIYAKGGSKPFAANVKVIDESGEKVVYLDKSLKKRSFPRKMVGRVVKKRTDIHEFLDRSDVAEDPDAVMALAEWALGKRFRPEVMQGLYKRALRLDANHEAANLALGRVRHEGEWMTPAERDQRQAAAADAAMRAKGLVKWEDQWVTPEDKANLEKGLRKHNGKWMTEDEIKRAQGFVQHNGKWIKKSELAVLRILGHARKDTGLGDRLQLVQTEHFAAMGDLQPAQLQQLAQTMEKLLREFQKVFPDADPQEMLPEKYKLLVFRKGGPYQRLIRNRFKRQKETENWSERFAKEEGKRVKLRLRATSFWDVQPEPLSAHVQMPDPFEGLRAHCVHFAANVLFTRYSKLRFPTWWLNEGVAYYFEKKVSGGIQTYSVDTGLAKYADAGPLDQEKKNPWLEATKWNNLLLGLVRAGRDPKLQKMKNKNLWKPRLKIPDVAKAYSVVGFLVRDDAKKFAAFVKDCKSGSGTGAIEREVNAVLKHYGSYKDIEKGWKAYALNGFRLSR